MPKPTRKSPSKRAAGRPAKNVSVGVNPYTILQQKLRSISRHCNELLTALREVETARDTYLENLREAQSELAEKQRDIERLRTELAEMTHRYEIRGELWQHLATKHRELADELSRIPRWIRRLYAQPSMAELLRRWRNQAPAPRPWWKRVWFK